MEQEEKLLRGEIGGLPQRALMENTLPSDYKNMYVSLVHQAAREMPLVDGYQTMHMILVERLAFMFVLQKQSDNRQAIDVDWKRYRSNFNSMMKAAEALLKELRAITVDRAFKHMFVTQVLEIINRTVSNAEEKRTIAKELRNLANVK